MNQPALPERFNTVRLLCDFRRGLEKLSKANGQTPPRSAGAGAVLEAKR
jgi:hypothetical protein